MGSITVAAWVAPLAFLVLIAMGWARREFGMKMALAILLAGAAVWLALPRMVLGGEYYATSALAAFDIALVFAVFRADVRLT